MANGCGLEELLDTVLQQGAACSAGLTARQLADASLCCMGVGVVARKVSSSSHIHNPPFTHAGLLYKHTMHS
jgi:hypothetical protein